MQLFKSYYINYRQGINNLIYFFSFSHSPQLPMQAAFPIKKSHILRQDETQRDSRGHASSQRHRFEPHTKDQNFARKIRIHIVMHLPVGLGTL